MTKPFKLLEAFREQVQELGAIKHAWFTSFNLNVDFFERHVLAALLQMDKPRSRIDFELMQQRLNGQLKQGRGGATRVESAIDVKVFADQRMYEATVLKRTAIEIYAVNPTLLRGRRHKRFDQNTLFHPKVIYLENESGDAVLGVGSANLSVSGWSTNQEVFTFHRIEHVEQSNAVREFFKPLFDCYGLGLKRRYLKHLDDSPQGAAWRFVHSFQTESMLECLFDEQRQQSCASPEKENQALAVWSPYFPSDMAGFVARLQQAYPIETLHLIPDLVKGCKLRTQWQDALQHLIQSQQLHFYQNPVIKDPSSDLCHAKVWMTEHKLAIGSWNFTAPGSNIDLGSKHAQVNIEAGVILTHQQPLHEVLQAPVAIGTDNFMQPNEMEQHALTVPKLLPVDITVSFDWQNWRYCVHVRGLEPGMDWQPLWLSLPDVAEKIELAERLDANRANAMQWCTFEIELASEPNNLLLNHAFALHLDATWCYRGFIVEHNRHLRRVEQFASLDEIFSSWIAGRSSDGVYNASLRSELLNHELDELQEEATSSAVGGEHSPSLSYFRMFQAMHSFELQIQEIKSDPLLEQYAFVVPGCLLELGEKIRAELALASSSEAIDAARQSVVFNWYMAQEFNLLVKQAKTQAHCQRLQQRIAALRIEHSDRANADRIKPSQIGSAAYREVIKQECHYDAN